MAQVPPVMETGGRGKGGWLGDCARCLRYLLPLPCLPPLDARYLYFSGVRNRGGAHQFRRSGDVWIADAGGLGQDVFELGAEQQ